MRTLAKVFGYSGGVVVVIVAGQYAYMASDSAISGAIWGFIYGFIAVGGLFGPALAARVWRYNKPPAVFIGAVALASLVIAISNEIGAMAGRGSEQTAQRTRVADTVHDARRSLALAEAERAGLKFAPADATAVQASKAKADAATSAKNAECAVRGPKCREKETVEGQALADLAAVTNNKALTDRAAKLDADIAALQEKINHAGPVRETNSQGKALARLFGLDDAEAAKLITRQNTAMMIVVELLIVALILAAEEIEKNERTAPASLRTAVRRGEAASAVLIECEEIEEPEARYEALEPAREAPRPLPAPRAIEPQAKRAAEAAGGSAPQPFPAPTRPRLVASEAAPVGNVVEIMAAIMEPGRGKVEIMEVYAAYSQACKASGKRPVEVGEFASAISDLCNELGISIQDSGRGMFLMGVKVSRAKEAVQ